MKEKDLDPMLELRVREFVRDMSENYGADRITVISVLFDQGFNLLIEACGSFLGALYKMLDITREMVVLGPMREAKIFGRRVN